MKIKQFEDIESWKKARELVRQIYSEFSPVRDYGFKDQIQRAAVSVMCNIAEGFDRGSNKEFVQFLVISRGSVCEVKSLSYAALDLGYINSSAFCRNIGTVRYIDQSHKRLYTLSEKLSPKTLNLEPRT
jgi:four helix bundle protein